MYSIIAPKYTTVITRGHTSKIVCVVMYGTPFPEYNITALLVVPKQKQRNSYIHVMQCTTHCVYYVTRSSTMLGRLHTPGEYDLMRTVPE